MRIHRLYKGAAVAALLCANIWAQAQAPAQGQGPQWKSREEYDLVQSIGAEKDLTKKIALLDQWKQKFPETEFKLVRAGNYLQTYQQLKDVPKMIVAAQEVIDIDPKNSPALTQILVMAMQSGNTSPEMLAFVDKTAQTLIANINEKPKGLDDNAWKTQKPITEAFAYRALGWTASVRKDTAGVQQNWTKSLELNPAQGDLSYSLGQAIVGLKDAKVYPVGLFHIARGAVYDGPGALPAATRTQVDQYFQKAYKSFHGDASGMDEVKTLVKTTAVPPAGWTIKSSADVEGEKQAKEAAEAAQNPQLALFKKLKDALMAADGQQYFESGMKDAAFPEMTGHVIEHKGKEIVLGVTNKTTPEVTLVFESPVPGKVEPGTQLTFTGVAKSYTKEPFMLMIETERKDVKGLPTAAPAKKPAARRPAGKKK